MSRWSKSLFIVVAILVAFAAVLVVLANVLITPERVREALLPLAEENLNRKLELGDVKVSLFSGIEIHGLTIYEEDGRDVFLSTDLVRLRYQLLPLLRMKVVIDEVRLDKPAIRIVRFENGQYNFSDLISPYDDKSEQGSTNQDNQPTDEQARATIDLLVSNVLLQDGHLTFLDHVLNDEAPYRYEISSLQISANGVSYTGHIPLSIQCQINGSQLALDGYINLLPFGVDLNVELQQLDVVSFKPYLQNIVPGKLESLKLNLKSTLNANFDEVSMKGSLSFAELYLLLDALPDAPLEDARLNVNYDLLLSYKQGLLTVNQLGFDYNGIKLDTKGEITGLTSEPALAMTLTSPGLQIRNAIDAVPSGLVGDVSSFDPAGTVAFEAILDGRFDEPLGLLSSATLDLENVQATVSGSRPAFSGKLFVTGNQMSSDGLNIRLGDNNADIDIKANNLFSPPIVAWVDISSDRFLLEPLLAGSAGATVATDQNVAGKEGPSDQELGPFDIPLRVTGTMNIVETLWKGLVVNDFLAQYSLKENIFILDRLDATLAGGTFKSKGRADLNKKGLDYSLKMDLAKIQTDPLFSALIPKAEGGLSGAMDLTFAFDGHGTQWQTISRHLSGHGKLLVEDGRITNPSILNDLSSFLPLPNQEDLQFDDFKAQFKVVDGKIQLDGQIVSHIIKFFPKGSVGLNGSLNLAIDTRVSPELSAKFDRRGEVLSYLADSDGWTQVPLLLKGDLSSPSFGLDPKGVQAQAARAITNELGRQVERLIHRSDSSKQKNESQQPEKDSGNDQDPARKLLQDSLQKLFGN